jgi:O-antigen ligase
MEPIVDPESGQLQYLRRLCSTGIYNDPNDLCLILVTAMVICLYWLGQPRSILFRVFCFAAIGLFGYALFLTKSRGGFLAMVVALLVLLHSRLGRWKTIALAAVLLPPLFLVFGGRQTEVSAGEGTAQQRIQFWDTAIVVFKQYPVFGVGYGFFVDENAGHVAHNSFVQCYAELGFLGGTLFVGAFYLAVRRLRQLGSIRGAITDPEQRRLRPYITAIVGGYIMGICSLSRQDVAPTYMVLALASMYSSVAGNNQVLPKMELNGRLIGRLIVVSLATMIGIYVFVRVFVRY